MVTQGDILKLVGILTPRKSRFEKIRVGDNCDGGYVVDSVLSSVDGVISIGIGWQVSFDMYFANRGINVFQYDHTIPGAPVIHPHLHWKSIGWGNGDGLESLDQMYRGSGLSGKSDLVLKFDVEGAEWDCLSAIKPELLRKFKVIVCELHGFFHLEDQQHFKKVMSALELLTAEHTVTHIHPNNCRQLKCVLGVPLPTALEVTLLRNDLGPFENAGEKIPGDLDFRNDPSQPEAILSGWV